MYAVPSSAAQIYHLLSNKDTRSFPITDIREAALLTWHGSVQACLWLGGMRESTAPRYRRGEADRPYLPRPPSIEHLPSQRHSRAAISGIGAAHGALEGSGMKPEEREQWHRELHLHAVILRGTGGEPGGALSYLWHGGWEGEKTSPPPMRTTGVRGARLCQLIVGPSSEPTLPATT